MQRYQRVLPRDLFNEANLLKCYGRLWILLGQTPDHHAALVEEDVPFFDIRINEGSGGLTVYNLTFTVRGVRYRLERPLNSRAAWPLMVEGYDVESGFDAIDVFDEHGNLSPEMLSFIRS